MALWRNAERVASAVFVCVDVMGMAFRSRHPVSSNVLDDSFNTNLV